MSVRAVAPPSAAIRRSGFVLAVGAAIAMTAGASAPSPFYPVLQEQMGFSAATLTGIFAIYVVALLATLLAVGSVSDHLGRRSVVSVGFVVLAASMIGFWHADSVTELVLARIVQGVASGLLMPALSAMVVDFESPDRPGAAATLNTICPLIGMASGPLLAGALLDRTSSALGEVFGGLTAVYVLLAVVVWLVPETSARRDGLLRSLVPRVGVPATARRPFGQGTPALFAGWATGGFYLSLGAPLVSQELGGELHVQQGLVVTALAGAAAFSCFVARHQTSRRVTIGGTSALAIGTALTIVALVAGTYWGFVAASVVAGAGFGAAFLGIMRSITPAVAPHERGELFAAVYVVGYLAFSGPAVVAGTVSPHVGLAATTYVYAALVVLLACTAALLRRFGSTD